MLGRDSTPKRSQPGCICIQTGIAVVCYRNQGDDRGYHGHALEKQGSGTMLGFRFIPFNKFRDHFIFSPYFP